MAFIRVRLNNRRDLEWGYWSEIVPCVGDTLWLYVEEPDCKERTGNDYIEATVVSRLFPIDPDDEDGENEEVWLKVHSENELEPGMIADSAAWPASEYSARKEEIARFIEDLGRRDKPLA